LLQLHLRQDGLNPHSLKAIKLVLKDSLLFTRYSYQLSSPAMSHLVGEKLKMLVMGTLTIEEKAALPFNLNSTEKGLSKTLLGIRGVKRVLIQGRGILEGRFAETLKATLIQPPGTGIIEVQHPELQASTNRLYCEGEISSRTYGTKARRPYPTRPAVPEYNFEAVPRGRKD
jgi:hypothetical protein